MADAMRWGGWLAATVIACATTARDATAQSQASLSTPHAPLGVTGDHKDTDITSDGEWILFWDTAGSVCRGNPPERIARSRADGTQYEVVITYEQLTAVDANPETGNQLDCTRLEISGDGRFALLRSYAATFACSYMPPISHYWIDVDAKQIGHLTYEGRDVIHPTLTEDGTLCFAAWNADMTERSIYLASAIDGSDAVKVFTGPPDGFLHSVISGDGSTILIQIRLAPAPFEGDLHLLDVGTGAVSQVTSLHDPALVMADISDDGSRIIYATQDGRITTVLSDGTVVLDLDAGGTGVRAVGISGDGEWVRYQVGGTLTTTRARFDGTGADDLFLVTAEVYIFSMNARGMSHDARVFVGERSLVEPYATAYKTSVWNADGPNLYTSGFAAPGTPVQVAVGGALGSAYVLGVSLGSASIPVPRVGTLTLDPATLQVLEMGVIDNALENSVAHLYDIPSDLPATPALDVFFQAYVVPPGGPPRLTNGTTFTIRDYDPLPYPPPWNTPTAGDSQALTLTREEADRAGARRFAEQLARLPIPPSPAPPTGPGDLTPEQRLALDILSDPGAMHTYEHTVYRLLMDGYAVDSPEVRELWDAGLRR